MRARGLEDTAASVDDEVLSADVGREGRGQEHDGRRHLLRSAGPAGRDSLGQTATVGVIRLLRLGGNDPAGHDIHPNALVAVLDRDQHLLLGGRIFDSGDRATGEAYCIAHHLTLDDEHRRMMVAYLRYLDTFAKIDGAWLFSERLLYVDWLEQRALS